MMLTIIKNRNSTHYVLIDTYSGLAFCYAFVCAMLCRLIGLRYLPILRGGDLPKMLLKNKFISKMIFSHSKINISPSLYMKSKFQEIGLQTKYIPNSIDIDKYKFKHRKKCKPKFLWVRSFHKVYNPEMAIKVFYEIKKKIPSAQLCMVGPDKDGSMIECKELVKKLKIYDCVYFTEILSKEDWTDISSQYDIFLNTTNFDNQPVSVIEAMALGLPIVSTNAGGLPFLHKNGSDALLNNKNDVNGMTKSVLRIINDNDMASKLSFNARKKAENFDWIRIQASWQKELDINYFKEKNINKKTIQDIYDIYMSKKSFINKWSLKNFGNIIISKERLYYANKLLKNINVDLKNKKILDVGCAGGNTVKLMMSLGANEKNIYGIDIRQNRIEHAKMMYPSAKFFKMDARNIKYPDNKFDFINTFTLFSSIKDSKSRKQISNEIQRVLKPNGLILYYDLRYANPINKNVVRIDQKEIDYMFPKMKKIIKLITVMPPLVRSLGAFTISIYPILSKISILRTHYIGLFRKT